MGVPTLTEKLDTIAKANGATNDVELAAVLNVKSRQSIHNWRSGGSVAGTNRDRIDREYQKALQIQRDSHRDDDDYRRRAIAAINMLEGDALRAFSRALVAMATGQEAIEPGEAVGLMAVADALLNEQNPHRTEASA